jgi:SAM-dependent methyltransferase
MQASQDLSAVVAYYERRLREHGAAPAGVDWRDAASQRLRFDRLLTLCGAPGRASILDVGCGYGALLPFMRARGFGGDYHGIDASAKMIALARTAHVDPAARFTCASLAEVGDDAQADFVLASGTFNVKLDQPRGQWEAGVLRSLDRMHALARRGHAFNCLSSHSDPDRMVERLYYADPMFIFDYCRRTHARHVSLLHDYGLYEFTLVARREPAH